MNRTVQGYQAAASPGDYPHEHTGRRGRVGPATRPEALTVGKQSLRKHMRDRRRRLPHALQADHAATVAGIIAAQLHGHDTLGVYLARDGEVDLAPLIELCWQRAITVAVPIIDGQDIRFAAYRPNEAMRRNRFDIAEPLEPAWRVPTLILTPLVAFDGDGHRLGMGGGYYDRYLAAHPDSRRLGVAHECQRATSVPATDADVSLPAVVTECGWQTFAPLADTREAR